MSKNIGKGKKRFKLGVGANILFTFVFIIFAIYAISLIYPFIWSFLNSIKTNEEYWSNSFNITTRPQWSNFISAFTELKVPKNNPLNYGKKL